MESTRGPPRVKNKAPAPQQISAEQLLREAVDRQELTQTTPTTRFADLEELHEYQGRKRKEFEDYVRRNRLNINNFLRYAQWELEQKEFRRARSIFERALDVHPANITIWLRYVDAELLNRNIMHARNLLDRAVTILPRVDKLWFKYVTVEETLGNVAGTREVFERWLKWEPDVAAWSAAIKMEIRYGEYDRARELFRRLTYVHPEPAQWLKWVRFETEHGTTDLVREVFAAAIEELGEDFLSERIFIEFAKFESRLKEYERARAIYKFALDRMPRSKSVNLHKSYTTFEKQFGDEDGVEDVVLSKRRVQYEEELKQNPKNYDTWIDLARLEETAGDIDRTRDVYERAIAQIPPAPEKRYWRRYIYLFLFYATWEETTPRDMDRVAQIYQECIKLIPHKKFTFAKVWLNKARFEIRQMQLQAARKTLGQAIGMCPKDKLYKGYIELEIKLYEFDRCRKLYEKYVSWNPANAEAWKAFAELERGLDDSDRTRAIFELAIDQEMLDMPELVWKEFIDFETEQQEYDRARQLYERLLQKTSHVKVWISYAHFEINVPDEGEEEDENEDEEKPISNDAKKRARAVFERAYKVMKEQELKEERVVLLNAWKSFETTHGTAADLAKVEKQMPSRVKKRRKLDDDTFEEYMDWLFPADDEREAKLSNLLAMAQKWKQSQQEAGAM
ncbi:putative Pre-mRNA-splicing factor clf1 [Trichodelitschia bisporula]|uniref:Putative Pre-mRNA-splicing factor clf1 n=1 Tax=Trichodelitschia bisporula TaxID=703511 RepID=A0A6G1IAH3_9PEZI|nr:putative Pre-mRNA-splicing factor clf1 [Trichodelitschia bisporula]